MSAYRLAPAATDLVTAYENDLWDIGQRPDHKVLWGARWFCAHIGEPQAFAELPLEQQLAVNPAVHRFVSWLIATRRLRPGPDSDLRNRLVACALICLFVIELFPKTAEIRPGVR
jgi:hypothetical protein